MRQNRADKAIPHPASADPPLPGHVIDALRQFDTCTISNAIERFGARLRNEGFTEPGLQCLTGGFPRVIGYAATFKIRSSDPPMTGGTYLERTDWWDAIADLPAPRIAVIQHIDADSGSGSVAGEVHAAILKAFGCGGLVTNGAIRDLPALARMRFPVFARGLAVSHSYAHMVEFGGRVEVCGMEIGWGDLIYADCHGALQIPVGIAAGLPDMAARIKAGEERVIAVCESAGFSPEALLKAIKSTQ